MSLSAIAGGSSQLANIQSNYQQVRNQFKQLGQDLQSGSLTKAQTDFVSLSQSFASQLSGTNPVAKTLSQIGQALQSGDLSAAQQAFATIGKVAACAVPHHSHVPPMSTQLKTSLDQLGQALQSGNVSTAQQAFAAVQQVWQQMSGDTLTPSDTPMQTSATSVTA
jgi:soluble cytochrome b562